jgi:hypothetical protein
LKELREAKNYGGFSGKIFAKILGTMPAKANVADPPYHGRMGLNVGKKRSSTKTQHRAMADAFQE